jgi:DNA-binding MarR family transcriptional regulator
LPVQYKRSELYSFITGKATVAITRRLLKNFREVGIDVTIEQWSVLYQLWKQDGLSQQQLCDATFKDKPSITRLVDNMEKNKLVRRIGDRKDRRIKLIQLTKEGRKLEEESMTAANRTLNEALEGVKKSEIEVAKKVLQMVYDNLK